MNDLKTLVIVIISLIISLNSCKKDNEVPFYDLTEEELSYIPYDAGEILVYEESQGNKIEFQVQIPTERIKTWRSGGQSGYTDFDWKEVKVDMQSDIAVLQYGLYSNTKGIGNGKSTLGIIWDSNNDEEIHCVDLISIPIDSSYAKEDLIHYDSLIINNIEYKDVFKGQFEQTPNGITITETYPVFYFYNVEHGIVKFILNDSTELYLK